MGENFNIEKYGQEVNAMMDNAIKNFEKEANAMENNNNVEVETMTDNTNINTEAEAMTDSTNNNVEATDMMNETNNNMDGVGTLGEVPFDDLAEIIPQNEQAVVEGNNAHPP